MKQRIRLEFDIDDPTYLPPNLMDSALRTPQAFRAASIRVEVALFHGHTQNKTLVTDSELAGVVSLGLGAKDRGTLSGPYIITPATAPLVTGLTQSNWAAGTGWHAAITLNGSATITNVCALQLVLYSIDASGVQAPLGITNLDLRESGLGGDQLPVSSQRTRVTTPFQMRWPDGLWYTISPVMGDDGRPTLAISETSES